MKIMLDSGAYSAHRKKTKIDIDKYIEFVRRNSNVFEVCVNLDVIGDGRKSYENWMYLRRNGIETMPVYHIGSDIKWLEKYLRKCDYIGIGAIANLSALRRLHGLTYVWDKYLRGIQCKVHGMGLTAIDILVRYPWYSVDSMSPIMQAAYGGIYVPRIEDGEFNFLKLDCYKVSNKSNLHQTGSMASYFSLPVSIKHRYQEYFESQGYVLGQLSDPKETPMFTPMDDTNIDSDVVTLAGHYMPRVDWNLDMWAKLIENIRSEYNNDMTIHVGSIAHFKQIHDRNLANLLTFFTTNSDKSLNNLLNQITADENK